MTASNFAMRSQSSTQEVLEGLIERVTYHNAENGFCVLRTKARGHRDVVTVVGHAARVAAGEWITAAGEWMNEVLLPTSWGRASPRGGARRMIQIRRRRGQRVALSPACVPAGCVTMPEGTPLTRSGADDRNGDEPRHLV